MIYKHVAVIGIDGMGNFNSKTDTPNLDRIFQNGAVTYNALSMDPTISAENWGAMLIGANPLVHGLTNTKLSQKEYTSKENPSIFKRIREKMPECYLASACNWNPINLGAVENGIGVDKITAESDRELTPKIVDCVYKKPTFLFVQFDDTDGAGHRNNFGSEEQLKAIRDADTFTGKIYDAYEGAGIIDETLFITIADHGGYLRSHGGYTDAEKYVFLGVSGKDVKKGQIKDACTKDIAAIVLYALGIELPKFQKQGFSSQVPEGIFENSPKYITDIYEKIIIKTTPTPNTLFDIFPKDDFICALHLDNSLEDASGHCRLEECGTVKYYSNGVNDSCGEFGMTGYAKAQRTNIKNGSYTISAWLKIEPSIIDGPTIVSNTSWVVRDRDSLGFNLSMRNNDICFNLGNGKECSENFVPFPNSNKDEWVHFIISVSKEKSCVTIYANFVHQVTIPLSQDFFKAFPNDTIYFGNDASERYNTDIHKFIFRCDDIFIFNRPFNEEDVIKLKNYYN